MLPQLLRQHLGHPACWDENTIDSDFVSAGPQTRGLSYERCCLIEPTGDMESGKPLHEVVSLGIRSDKEYSWHLDYKHPRLENVRSLQGCEAPAWDELLYAVKIKGGCLPCGTPPHDLDRYVELPHVTQEGTCLAGRMLVALSSFLSIPELAPGKMDPTADGPRAEALRYLEVMEGELRSVSPPVDFFDVFGLTAAQVRYMLLHTSLQANYTPIADYSNEGGELLIFDLGMSGGMDTLFYLLHGFRVVSVEANPMVVLDGYHGGLEQYSERLHVLNSVLREDSANLAENSDGGIAAVLPFHIHRERPDFSALDESRVPPDQRAGTMPVPAISCAELVQRFRRPYGVKIDVEGAGESCLRSLRSAAAAPQYVSAELPHVIRDGEKEARDLVLLLVSLGYDKFKLCRQSLYNVRTVWSVDQETNQTDLASTRQGVGLGASGLFGEHAVDWRSGLKWRTAAEITSELGYWGPNYAVHTMMEWFDLHAKLSHAKLS